jgi:hypothetical protein
MKPNIFVLKPPYDARLLNDLSLVLDFTGCKYRLIYACANRNKAIFNPVKIYLENFFKDPECYSKISHEDVSFDENFLYVPIQ